VAGSGDLPSSGPTPNPWLSIPAEDYEGHMGPQGADQLMPLATLLGDVYQEVRPARLALLGCATGNGLAQVDLAVTHHVLAVDVHPGYLAVLEERHGRLGQTLCTRCLDLERDALPEAGFDLVFAGLLFEHVDVPVVTARAAAAVAPGGTLAVVLQLPSDAAAVTPTHYPSLASLRQHMHLVPPGVLTAALEASGLKLHHGATVTVRNGKQLRLLVFRRPPAS
jgi:hypothetical protein